MNYKHKCNCQTPHHAPQFNDSLKQSVMNFHSSMAILRKPLPLKIIPNVDFKCCLNPCKKKTNYFPF